METLRDELNIPDSAPTAEKNILQPNHIIRLFEPSDKWYADAIGLKW
jgi:hypothetical protein